MLVIALFIIGPAAVGVAFNLWADVPHMQVMSLSSPGGTVSGIYAVAVMILTIAAYKLLPEKKQRVLLSKILLWPLMR